MNACGCPDTAIGVQHRHDCWLAKFNSPNPPKLSFSPFDPNVMRIAAALERIAAALERRQS